jgi:hypothetical protein
MQMIDILWLLMFVSASAVFSRGPLAMLTTKVFYPVEWRASFQNRKDGSCPHTGAVRGDSSNIQTGQGGTRTTARNGYTHFFQIYFIWIRIQLFQKLLVKSLIRIRLWIRGPEFRFFSLQKSMKTSFIFLYHFQCFTFCHWKIKYATRKKKIKYMLKMFCWTLFLDTWIRTGGSCNS